MKLNLKASWYLQIEILEKYYLKSSMFIQNKPSFTFLEKPSYLISWGVQRSDSSPQSPCHSNFPQGFLSCTSLTRLPCLSVTSAACIRPYEWRATRPRDSNLATSISSSYAIPAWMIYFFLSASKIFCQVSSSQVSYSKAGAPVKSLRAWWA